MEDMRYLNEAEDIAEDDLLDPKQEKQLKYTSLFGLLLLACSIFMPGSWAIGTLRIHEVLMAIGFLVLIIPLLFVSLHQAKSRKHFGWFLHLLCPVVGLLMVLSRVILQPLGASTVFLNLWSIGATFLVFPLFQQLIELMSGSVDMITDGNQVRYERDEYNY